eukprot:scaffold52383_cov55-Phaeocystis_antarctica.AAC.2
MVRFARTVGLFCNAARDISRRPLDVSSASSTTDGVPSSASEERATTAWLAEEARKEAPLAPLKVWLIFLDDECLGDRLGVDRERLATPR